MLRLEVKPNVWSCLATSMAMALQIATEEFYRLAGHDGSEIVFPWLLDPLCRQGFHIQEAIQVARTLGYAVTPFELFPQTKATRRPDPSIYLSPPAHWNDVVQIRYENKPSLQHNWELFTTLIGNSYGVIECQTASCNWHAVAFDRNIILNPDGETFGYSREECEVRGLFTKRLWTVTKC